MTVNDPQTLQARAREILGDEEPVLAAGIFGLKDGYTSLTTGGLLGSVAGSAIGGGVGGVIGNGVGMQAARQTRAAEQGVTVRMLVAVTAQRIHILDWLTGSGPREVLRSYDRASTRVEIKKFGVSRRMTLQSNSDEPPLALTGNASVLSAESKGDKDVLAALAS